MLYRSNDYERARGRLPPTTTMYRSNKNKRARGRLPSTTTMYRSNKNKRARGRLPSTTTMYRSNENKRARGHLKRTSFTDDLNIQTLPEAVTLLRKLNEVDFGTFESQLQPVANGMSEFVEPSTLLRECLKFLVLKKIVRDEDAKILSPTDVIDSVWHQLLLNPRLYKNINDALGGEMIDHNPEGGRDVAARNERVSRTIDMYKFVFITPATSASSSMWKVSEEMPPPDDCMLIAINDVSAGEKVYMSFRKTMRIISLYSAVAKHKVVPMDSLRLILDGEPLRFGDILGDVVNDGDVIDLFRAQVGC